VKIDEVVKMCKRQLELSAQMEVRDLTKKEEFELDEILNEKLSYDDLCEWVIALADGKVQ